MSVKEICHVQVPAGFLCAGLIAAVWGLEVERHAVDLRVFLPQVIAPLYLEALLTFILNFPLRIAKLYEIVLHLRTQYCVLQRCNFQFWYSIGPLHPACIIRAG